MAGAFRFRLEVVRRIRREARDAQRRVVSEAVRALTRIRDRIDARRVRLDTGASDMREAQHADVLDVATLRRHHQHRAWLKRSIEDADVTLASNEQELATEQSKLAELTNRFRAIERLRERQWGRYVELLAKAERAEGDEAALHAYIRNRRLGGGEVMA